MPITSTMKSLLFTAPAPKPAERTMTTIEAAPKARILRVAAYCRVSTDLEEQEGSIVAQREHFLELAAAHADWTLQDIYYEQGESGTNAETRPELQRLLHDCRAGRIDLVLTKSMSRFARNTTDCLEMVRELTGIGVNILFEKEKIDTRNLESEFLMTILASLAEEESHSISGNCRWAIQKRFEDGTYRPGTAPYGYDLIDGSFVLNETEANVVRLIFDKYLEGAGCSQIADYLNHMNIKSKRAGSWNKSTIARMLRNVDYVGDALLQKTYRDERFRRTKNEGQYPQYYVSERHPAIIPRDAFDRVQELLDHRRPKHTQRTDRVEDSLTGKIFCGRCGSPRVRMISAGPNRVQWVCKAHKKHQCEEMSVLDENIRNCWQTMVNKLRYAPILLEAYRDDLEAAWLAEHPDLLDLQARLDALDCEQTALDGRYVKGEINSPQMAGERNRLKREIDEVAVLLRSKACPEAEQVQWFLDDLEKDPDRLFTEFVERVECSSRTTLRFHFKFGLTLTETAL